MTDQGLQPAATYKDIPIFLFQDEGMQASEYGAVIAWYGRLAPVEVEDWQRPTRANLLKAAETLIDLLKAVEGEGLLGPDGYLTSPQEPGTSR